MFRTFPFHSISRRAAGAALTGEQHQETPRPSSAPSLRERIAAKLGISGENVTNAALFAELDRRVATREAPTASASADPNTDHLVNLAGWGTEQNTPASSLAVDEEELYRQAFGRN